MKAKLILTVSAAMLLVGCFKPNYEKTTIQNVVTDVKSTLLGFNGDNVSEIGRTIKSNINEFDGLIKDIDKAKTYDQAFPHIVKTVDKLALNYKKISDKKEKIRKTLIKRVKQIEKQRELAVGKIGYIEDKISNTNRELANETLDYRKSALQITLKFQKQELDVWQRFATGMQFNILINRLESASNGINSFVDILSTNEMVYTQASSTLHAISDYRSAKQDLQEVLANSGIERDEAKRLLQEKIKNYEAEFEYNKRLKFILNDIADIIKSFIIIFVFLLYLLNNL
jgi:phage-related protein